MNEQHEDTNTAKDRLLRIIERAASPKFPLTLSTAISTDLGFEGDEANELMQEISQEFNVDLSEIDSRYFDDEFKLSIDIALLPLFPLIWLGMLITGKGKKIELLIGDLLKAVESGHWKHPEREGKYPWQRIRKHTNRFE